MEANAPAHTEHPAPHRAHASLLALWTGLMLAPGAWFIALAVETPLLSQACYPGDVAFVGALPDLHPLVLAVDAVTLAVVAFAALVAWRAWRRTAGEKSGDGHRLMASGDGRTRFMAMSGLITSGIVGMAVLYTLIAHAMLPGCGT
jgi:hypothetical protein